MLHIKKISITIAIALSAALALAPGSSAATVPTTLKATQKVQLKNLIEEVKMAKDVYTYFATKVTTLRFSNIARSEQAQVNYLASILTKYQVANPTTGKAPGKFVNIDFQNLYTAHIVEGSANSEQAFGVAENVENAAIASLKKLLANPVPDDVKIALELLLAASYNHLEAFSY